MTNVQITNGVVKYGRTMKTGDYENKRADVELSFTVPEGEDGEAAIAKVGSMAAAHCVAILGAAPDSALATNAPEVPAKGKAAAAPAKAAEKPAEKASEKTAADASEIVDDTPVPAFIKGQMLDAATGKPSEKPKAAAEAVEENIDDLLGGGEAAKEITDKELTDATQKCQVANKNAPAIRKALKDVGVTSPPGRIIDIAQDKRQTYLDKLKEIKPLA